MASRMPPICLGILRRVGSSFQCTLRTSCIAILIQKVESVSVNVMFNIFEINSEIFKV